MLPRRELIAAVALAALRKNFLAGFDGAQLLALAECAPP